MRVHNDDLGEVPAGVDSVPRIIMPDPHAGQLAKCARYQNWKHVQATTTELLRNESHKCNVVLPYRGWHFWP